LSDRPRAFSPFFSLDLFAQAHRPLVQVFSHIYICGRGVSFPLPFFSPELFLVQGTPLLFVPTLTRPFSFSLTGFCGFFAAAVLFLFGPGYKVVFSFCGRKRSPGGRVPTLLLVSGGLKGGWFGCDTFLSSPPLLFLSPSPPLSQSPGWTGKQTRKRLSPSLGTFFFKLVFWGNSPPNAHLNEQPVLGGRVIWAGTSYIRF